MPVAILFGTLTILLFFRELVLGLLLTQRQLALLADYPRLPMFAVHLC